MKGEALKIVVLTTGQPSTNPRMVKEYKALKQAGYQVRVYCSFWEKWAEAKDEQLFQSGELTASDFILVGGSPAKEKWRYYFSIILHRVFKVLYTRAGLMFEAAFGRTAFQLIKAAKSERAHLYVAHNAGALPAAVMGAKYHNTIAVFDAEDFHRGEYKDPNSAAYKHLVALENKYLSQCSHVTTASPLIAQAYQTLYPQQSFTVLNNVFSTRHLQVPRSNVEGPLRLFWFSQTIGPHRGLETVARAMKLLSQDTLVELHLLGKVTPGFDAQLSALSGGKAIQIHEPVAPDEVFAIAAKYDVGLSIEVPDFENRDLCLTNKIFTYLLAANAIIFSNTKAQKQFVAEHPDVGMLFSAGDDRELALLIADLYANRQKLQALKVASWQLAKETMNWEQESQKLIALIHGLLPQ